MFARVEPLTSTRAIRGPFDYSLDGFEGDGIGAGTLLAIPFGGREVAGVVLSLSDTTEVPLEQLRAPDRDLGTSVPKPLVELAFELAEEYCSTPARTLSLVSPPGIGLGGRLPKRPLVLKAANKPDDLPQVGSAARVAPTLTTAQTDAMSRIARALEERSGGLLLHGVTGSGKTEVYLGATEMALASGGGAIVLVPEIALTPQTVARFRARFGGDVAVIHSALTPAQRRHEWLRLRNGQARVCVGPRSAVFAPIADLKLIVVDEEHDSSYKHEGDPRYDARRVAELRAAREGAVLICGSATPRAESFAQLERVVLPDRADGSPLPPVELIDMSRTSGALHARTLAALANVRERGQKAIVMLNRRGWSNYLSCADCGHTWECERCDVTLVLHGSAGRLECHHCGFRAPIPSLCPECSSSAVARHGAGTEQLERQLRRELEREGFAVLRLDSDSVAAGSSHAEVLSEFEQRKACVLIGTQMVAKGHDFPDVALAVVVDADGTLKFPDFRAEERTFQLVAQLAGRAGRGGAGQVLVQTRAPEAEALVRASHHDSSGFLAGELERRRVLAYPPYSTLVRIVCSAPDSSSGKATAAARAIADAVGTDGQTVLGPAPLFRLRNNERSQLLIKSTGRRETVAKVGAAVDSVARGKAHSGVRISVDVDPQ